MTRRKRAIVIDKTEFARKNVERGLVNEGFIVQTFASATLALEEILLIPPDLVVSEIFTEDIDGLELTQAIRKKYSSDRVKIVILTSKNFEADHKRAVGCGADLFIGKPFTEKILKNIKHLFVEKDTYVQFWGVRGTLPVPGPRYTRYGGNTSCISLVNRENDLLVFDAGSGAKRLADHLAKSSDPLKIHYYISHAHWDHINGLPFFSPLYAQSNTIKLMGPVNQDISFKQMISGQMQGIYFPITIDSFMANVSFQNLREETLVFDNYRISTMLLNHPGNCLGYKVECDGYKICYITDNEIGYSGSAIRDPISYNALQQFIKGADLLITDTTYTDEEYVAHVGWGHSSVSQVVELAHEAEVGHLALFHHDPDQDDDAIDRKYDMALQYLDKLNSPVRCHCPSEEDIYFISKKGIRQKKGTHAA